MSTFSLSATPSQPLPDDVVKDVTLATFKTDVLDASKQALVLVDFWAPWCGPCKQLTPILEKIAKESRGLVKLVKIDIDSNQPIAQQLGVQSVPSVFAFSQGRPVDAFAGALPEAQVKAWVEQLLKTQGSGVPEDKAGLDTALLQAAEFLAAKDFAMAKSIYADILDMEPTCAAAFAGLIRTHIDQNEIAEARLLFDQVPVDLAKEKIFIPLRTSLELLEQVAQAPGESALLESRIAKDPLDHQSRFDLAMAYFGSGKREEAVDALLEIVRRARSWNEDGARKQLVKFFEAFGPTDPLTLSGRKRLSSLLFS